MKPEDTQLTGTMEEAGEGWRLRFTRPLSHSQEKVWRAITEPEHLKAWFPQRITGEWVAGRRRLARVPRRSRRSPRRAAAIAS